MEKMDSMDPKGTYKSLLFQVFSRLENLSKKNPESIDPSHRLIENWSPNEFSKKEFPRAKEKLGKLIAAARAEERTDELFEILVATTIRMTKKVCAFGCTVFVKE